MQYLSQARYCSSAPSYRSAILMACRRTSSLGQTYFLSLTACPPSLENVLQPHCPGFFGMNQEHWSKVILSNSGSVSSARTLGSDAAAREGRCLQRTNSGIKKRRSNIAPPLLLLAAPP